MDKSIKLRAECGSEGTVGGRTQGAGSEGQRLRVEGPVKLRAGQAYEVKFL